MTTSADRRGLLRPATGAGAHGVTFVELFFDLVFVFAVTQVSHVLLHGVGLVALLHTLLLALVVWWSWSYTAWVTNWLHPDRWPVRILVLVLMLLGMLFASAIPDAFGSGALLFACSMVALQLTRSVFTAIAFARAGARSHAVNFVRISIWHAVPGVLWIAGALVDESARPWVWLAALVIDYAGPRLRFWTPGLGGSTVASWDVTGEHMSERMSTFVIIALGESIVVTGATFSERGVDPAGVTAFLTAFVGSVLLWLLYFSHGERRGAEYISAATERGMIAQLAFTYTPALLVIGIVLAAVADGLVLAAPFGPTEPWTAALVCGAPALYLVGNALFRLATGGGQLLWHLAGAAVTAALVAVAPLAPPAVLSGAVDVVLAATVVAEHLDWRRSHRPASR